MALLVLIPLILGGYLSDRYDKLNSEEYIEFVGYAYGETNFAKNRNAIWYLPLFLLRRLSFVLIPLIFMKLPVL